MANCFRKRRLESLRLKRAILAGRRLRWCPVCEYDLAGLPPDHTCPECGFAFSRDMRIWGSVPGATALFKARRFQVGLFLVQAVLAFFGVASLVLRDITGATLATGIVGLLAIALWHSESWLARLSQPGFVIVAKDRLVWGRARSPAEALAWTDLEVADDWFTMYQRVGEEWVELPRLPPVPVRGEEYRRLVNLIRARYREANGIVLEKPPLQQAIPELVTVTTSREKSNEVS